MKSWVKAIASKSVIGESDRITSLKCGSFLGLKREQGVTERGMSDPHLKHATYRSGGLLLKGRGNKK
jgi:hypothetical protein